MDRPTLTGSYIPKSDAGIRNWLNQFASTVAKSPAESGLTQSDSEVLSSLAAEYDHAYVVANNNATRTKGTVATKDDVRNQAVSTFRVYAMQVKMNLGVSEAKKLALGLHLDDETPTPIAAPTTVPVLSVVCATCGGHLLRFWDSAMTDSRAKPPGAIHLELHAAMGETFITDHRQARYIGLFTRNPMEVTFDYKDAGLTSSYFARWVTRRGLVGGWSNPVSMMVAFAAGPGSGDSRTAGQPNSRTGERAVRLAA